MSLHVSATSKIQVHSSKFHQICIIFHSSYCDTWPSATIEVCRVSAPHASEPCRKHDEKMQKYAKGPGVPIVSNGFVKQNMAKQCGCCSNKGGFVESVERC